MEDAKRQQLETQLRQLINAANRGELRLEPNDNAAPAKKIQVIRRRKGKPDRHILEGQSHGQAVLQQ